MDYVRVCFIVGTKAKQQHVWWKVSKTIPYAGVEEHSFPAKITHDVEEHNVTFGSLVTI